MIKGLDKTGDMQKKYSRNFIIGVSFLVALALVYFGVNYLTGINVLKKQNTYVVLFEDVSGLYSSSPIYVNGFQVGLINSIKMHRNDNPMQFAVDINLEGNYKIPKGSHIEFGSDFLGSSTASIVVDQESSSYYMPGDTLMGKRQSDMMGSVGEMVPKADSLLLHLDSVVISLNKLLSSPIWHEALKGIGSTIASLDRSSKSLDKVMVALDKDVPEITNNIVGISNDLKEVTDELATLEIEKMFNTIDVTMENIEELTKKLNRDDSSIGKLMTDTQLHDSLTTTLSSVSQLLEDIRRDPQKYLSVKVKLF